MKRFVLMTLLFAGLLLAGCASHKSSKTIVSSKPGTTSRNGVGTNAVSQAIITPDTSLAAKVVSYNSTGRFVVLSFPVGSIMPDVGQIFFLYRSGLKVAEIKISGPQRDYDIVADVITGDAQVGDKARNE